MKKKEKKRKKEFLFIVNIFIICSYMYQYCHWRSNYQEGRIWIWLTHLTLPHLCACPKSGPGFPMLYVVVLFYVQWFEIKGDCSFCWYWWNCWQAQLFKHFSHNTAVFLQAYILSHFNACMLMKKLYPENSSTRMSKKLGGKCQHWSNIYWVFLYVTF